MTLYVLSVSACYYPESGTGDWRGVFTDVDAGLEALKALDLRTDSACLIRVSDDGFGVVASRWPEA